MPTRESLYAQDFYAWIQEQAILLRKKRFTELDVDNLIEELEGVASKDPRRKRRGSLLRCDPANVRS
jgi:hypothetical protein